METYWNFLKLSLEISGNFRKLSKPNSEVGNFRTLLVCRYLFTYLQTGKMIYIYRLGKLGTLKKIKNHSQISLKWQKWTKMTTSALGRCAVAQKLRYRPPFLIAEIRHRRSWPQRHFVTWKSDGELNFFYLQFCENRWKKSLFLEWKRPPLGTIYVVIISCLVPTCL